MPPFIVKPKPFTPPFLRPGTAVAPDMEDAPPDVYMGGSGAPAPAMPSMPKPQAAAMPPAPQQQKTALDQMQEQGPPPMPNMKGWRGYVGSFLSGGIPGIARHALNPDFDQKQAEYANKQKYLASIAGLEDKRLGRQIQQEALEGNRDYRAGMAADRAADNARQEQAMVNSLGEPVNPGEVIDPERYSYRDYNGRKFKQLTPFGKKEQEQKAAQDTYEALPEAVTSALGMPAGLKVPPGRADAFYRLYETHQNNKGKTPEAQVAERTKTADMVGLKGRDRQVYIATGNIERPAASAIVNLSPEALNLASESYERTGQMIPGLGRSGANTAAVLNNSARRGAVGSDVVAAGAGYKADAGSLKNLQKQRDQVLAFEDTASRNLDIADQMSRKVDRSGSPLVNKYLLWTKGQVSGDTDTALLENAVMTAANEYAKIVSGQTGGATTDAARHEGQAMLRSAMAKGTFSEVVKQMKREMANRRIGFDKQLEDARGRIGGTKAKGEGSVTPPPTNTPSAQVGQRVTLKSGKTVTITKVNSDGTFDYKE